MWQVLDRRLVDIGIGTGPPPWCQVLLNLDAVVGSGWAGMSWATSTGPSPTFPLSIVLFSGSVFASEYTGLIPYETSTQSQQCTRLSSPVPALGLNTNRHRPSLEVSRPHRHNKWLLPLASNSHLHLCGLPLLSSIAVGG